MVAENAAMGKKSADRSERSQERLTRRHLKRLGELADDQHARYTRPAAQGGKHAAWANRRVAVVLAQGAAQHFLHPNGGHGVKDLDVWTFYARRPSASLYPGRYETHADFGPSVLGRNLYPPPLIGRQKTWDAYDGRRVDFLVRELSVAPTADPETVVAALRDWLARGAEQRCRCGEDKRRNSSSHHLAHKAVVWIGTPLNRDRAGLKVWDSREDWPAS